MNGKELLTKIRTKLLPPRQKEHTVPWWERPIEKKKKREEMVWITPVSRWERAMSALAFILLIVNAISMYAVGSKLPATLGYLIPSALINIHYLYLLHRRRKLE